jgi:hypothetical protein
VDVSFNMMNAIYFILLLWTVVGVITGVWILIVSSRNQKQKLKKMEENNNIILSELTGIADRLGKVERGKMNNPQFPVNIDQAYKEAEYEEEN